MKTWTLRHADDGDISECVENPSTASLRERLANGASECDVVEAARHWLGAGNAYCATTAAGPLFVFGHLGSQARRATWCMLSAEAEAQPTTTMLAARHMLREERRKYPDARFEARTSSDHEQRDRFFLALGFRLERSFPDGALFVL